MAEKIETIIIDANDGLMGRIASFAAKQALLGKHVFIVNCENAMISGKKNVVVQTYLEKLARGGTAQKGPYIKRTTDGIFRRAVRGMLPWSKSRGREAFKRIKCYSGVPSELQSSEKINFKKPFYTPYITLKELLKLI
jgi:large subunit ribosomal protein L13